MDIFFVLLAVAMLGRGTAYEMKKPEPGYDTETIHRVEEARGRLIDEF